MIRVPALVRATVEDADDLRAFLGEVDLTISGLDSPDIRLWIDRDDAGRVIGTTGFELSTDGAHALIRSVAVRPELRSAGRGSELAQFALAAAAQQGARTAWLFSRRSGPFWQELGFQPADRDALAIALGNTHQVRLFIESGQLEREVAWVRALTAE